MLITGRKWWDLIIYNPNNRKKDMLVYRILPDQEAFKKLNIGLAVGEEKIKLIKNKIQNYGKQKIRSI